MKRAIIVASFIALLAILSMSQTCPRGCSACTGISCSSCESAFIKNGTRCVPCGMDCSACTIVDRKIVCSACNTPTNVIINGACTPCAAECVAGQCSGNPNFCTTCKYGITPVNGTCPKPNCTMEGCGNCPTPSTCTTCIRGYYKDGSNICQKCSSAAVIGGPKCVACSGATTCTLCVPGFYIDTGVCTACQANAITCTSSTATLCKPGYRPNGANCDRCTPPCKTCSSSVTTCTSCLPPTTLKTGNICQICKQPCLTCEASPNEANCITCVRGFSMKANTAKKCFKCKEQLCRLCDETDPSKCIVCADGSALNSTGNCNPCPVGCQECNADSQKNNTKEDVGPPRLLQQSRFLQQTENRTRTNQNVNQDNDNIGGTETGDRRIPGNQPVRPTYDCTKCQQGSALIQGRCKPCMVKGCLDCDSTLKVCLKCIEGSFLAEGQCRKCQRGCKICSEAKNCDQLFDGWVAMANSDIVKCRPGCMKCDAVDPTSCSMCSEGNYMVPTKTICTMCPAASNCRTCNPSTPTTCLSCKKDDHLIGTVCKSCDVSCLTCAGVNDAGLLICKTCPKGSFLGGDANTTCIKAATTCGQNAVACSRDDNTKCEKCRFGYACTDDGKCAKCLSGCSECAYKATEIGQVCLGCPRGFEKNGTKCVPCPTGAEICKRGQPIRCQPQFELREMNQEIKCLPKCAPPCINCTRTNNTEGQREETCDACMKGYTLNADGKCTPTDCGSSCTNCVFGTFKSGSTCPACTVANCVSCADATAVCYGCREGFYLAADMASCIKCSVGCWDCDTATKCKVCAIGFYREVKLESDDRTQDEERPSCLPCEPQCLTCIGSNYTCTSCKTGFFKNGTRCLSDQHIGVKVTFDTDYTTFTNNGNSSDIQKAIKQKCRDSNKSLGTNGAQNEYTSQGSVISEDVISVPTGTTVADMTGIITEGYKAAGFSITSLQIAVFDSTGAMVNTINVGMIVGIVLGSVALLAIIIVTIVLCVWWRRKKAQQSIEPVPHEGTFESGNVKAY